MPEYMLAILVDGHDSYYDNYSYETYIFINKEHNNYPLNVWNNLGLLLQNFNNSGYREYDIAFRSDIILNESDINTAKKLGRVHIVDNAIEGIDDVIRMMLYLHKYDMNCNTNTAIGYNEDTRANNTKIRKINNDINVGLARNIHNVLTHSLQLVYNSLDIKSMLKDNQKYSYYTLRGGYFNASQPV